MKYFAVLLMCVSMSVFAGGKYHGGDTRAYGGDAKAKAYGGKAYGGKAYSGAVSGSQSTSGAISGSSARQKASVSSSQKQSQDQGNTQNISYTEDYPQSVPNSAWAPPTMVTAPCAIGISGGGQGMDFGLSIGTYYIDQECMLNRDIALYASMGMPPETLHIVMCQKESYREMTKLVADMECPVMEQSPKIIPATYKTCSVEDLDC